MKDSKTDMNNMEEPIEKKVDKSKPTKRSFLIAALSLFVVSAIIVMVVVPLKVVNKKDEHDGISKLVASTAAPYMPSITETPSSFLRTPSPTPSVTAYPTTIVPTIPATTPQPITTPPTTTNPDATSSLAPTMKEDGDDSFIWTQVGPVLTFHDDTYIPNLETVDQIIPSTESLSLSGNGKILIARFQELYVDESKLNESSLSLDYHFFVRIYYYKESNQWVPIPLESIAADGGAVVSGDATVVAMGVGKGIQVYRISDDYASLSLMGEEILYDGDEIASGFGRYLTLSEDGTTLAVGIPGADKNKINDGMVRVYGWDGNNLWKPIGQDIVGEDFADDSGSALDLSSDGTILAIGADGNDGDDERSYSLRGRGHVRLYQLDSELNEWLQLGSDIDGEGIYNKAGSSVVLSKDGVIVAVASVWAGSGACKNFGQVRVFEYVPESKEWIKLGQSMTGEQCGDEFGTSIAMSSQGDIVAIGSFQHDGSTSSESDANLGQVKVFRIDRTTNQWNQLGETILGEQGDGLGSAVSLDSSGTNLVVGSSGFYIMWGGGNTSISASGAIRTFQLSEIGL